MSKQNTLEGFDGWENVSSETDFFSMSESEITDEPVTDDEIIVDEKKDIVEDKKIKKEENLFNDSETIDTSEKQIKDKQEQGNIYLLNSLKEKGLLDYELEEGEELTDDLADDLIEVKFEERVDDKVKDLVNDLPKIVKDLVQYTMKGGSAEDFLNTINSSSEINLNINLDKKENQIKVLRTLLAAEDKDEEEIETEIEFLKDSGKLQIIAEKKFNKYKNEVEQEKEELVKNQQIQREKEKENIKKAKSKIVEILSETKEINGISFSKEDKRNLPNYMNDKDVKLSNGTLITEMQKDLFYELPKNEKALLQLASLLKNRNKDGTFNFSNIEKSINTKVTQEVRNNIRRTNQGLPNSNNKNEIAQKSIIDYFNN